MPYTAMPPSVPIQADCLIFDLFGVLVAFDDRLVYDQIAQRCTNPGAVAKELQDLVSEPNLIRGHTSFAELEKRLRQKFGFKGSTQDFERIWKSSYSEPMPGIRGLLLQLAGQCRLVLLSNVDPYYWPVVSSSIPELKSFHAQVLSFETGIAKPEKSAFRLAVAAAAVPVERCYFIDDKPENIEAASSVGLAGHVFHNTIALKAALRKTGLQVG
jgi:HAD superfamily hydrolase (TIGR01509 family)